MRRDDWLDPPAVDLGVLRFMTCGSVDDGKSTLIGRLLFDTKALLSDTLAVMHNHALKRGLSAPDLALLTDGLIAEREQGITIDVAYRYFATSRRKFIIADCPGHEQYTRNMVTAASTADAAVLLVDARKGLLPQTRRHAALASLLGVRHLVLAVNKMDLVEGSQAVFDEIVGEFSDWLAGHADLGAGSPLPTIDAVPMSALRGEMVVDRGDALPWYTGPTLIDLLESLPAGEKEAEDLLRLPVQWVRRPSDNSTRGYAGRIESGELSRGDEVIVWPSGQRSRVTRITIGHDELDVARAGQSVMVSLADERDISRGDLIVLAREGMPVSQTSLTVTVCWLSTQGMKVGHTYLLQHMTREVKAIAEAVEGVLDVSDLSWVPSYEPLGLNDIGRLRLRTQAVPAEPYRLLRQAGSFILVDPNSRDTVAAGLIE